MKIVADYPPNISEIRKVFPITAGVIFAWGDTIFSPDGIDVPPELIEHEEIHGQRQKGDPEGWWEQYLTDPAFRLAEEVPAHQAEFLWIMKNANRSDRRKALIQISNRLSSPLYGRIIRPKEAKKLIQKALDYDLG